MAQRNDPNYHKIAEELYRLNGERLRSVSLVQADYGKWLIATLSVIHSAAIYAVATSPRLESSHTLIVPFVVGLLLTLTSGLFTWTNFTILIALYQSWVEPAMLRDDAYWPTSSCFYKISVPATMVLALITGIGAATCILWGAYLFLHLK